MPFEPVETEKYGVIEKGGFLRESELLYLLGEKEVSDSYAGKLDSFIKKRWKYVHRDAQLVSEHFDTDKMTKWVRTDMTQPTDSVATKAVRQDSDAIDGEKTEEALDTAFAMGAPFAGDEIEDKDEVKDRLQGFIDLMQEEGSPEAIAEITAALAQAFGVDREEFAELVDEKWTEQPRKVRQGSL